ncbi:MAG: hypothetical protein OXI41_10800 [Chloroflexota bacterium]|nr:hypothetical protein [Chloroflexota bacterium]MDE2896373.1 hypothetical protein [Chloroflexota bacterium]
MTDDPRFPDEDFEDEPVEWIVADKPGAVIEVRFTFDEVKELVAEEVATGVSHIQLIHDLSLDVVRERQAKRSGQAEVAD